MPLHVLWYDGKSQPQRPWVVYEVRLGDVNIYAEYRATHVEFQVPCETHMNDRDPETNVAFPGARGVLKCEGEAHFDEDSGKLVIRSPAG